MTLGDLLLRIHEVCCCWKKSVCRRGQTRILTDSARKRNKKDVLWKYNKSRINIGHQYDVGWNWRKRWDCKLMLKCNCAYSLEIGRWIRFNDLGRQAAHNNKKQRKYTFFLSNLAKRDLYSCFKGIIQGRIQDFKLGGAHLKKLRRAEGGAKIFGVFRVKNRDFTPKNLIFSNCGGRREHFWGILCEKSRFYAKKSYFFQF
jgi:hypothetical protein